MAYHGVCSRVFFSLFVVRCWRSGERDRGVNGRFADSLRLKNDLFFFFNSVVHPKTVTGAAKCFSHCKQIINSNKLKDGQFRAWQLWHV